MLFLIVKGPGGEKVHPWSFDAFSRVEAQDVGWRTDVCLHCGVYNMCFVVFASFSGWLLLSAFPVDCLVGHVVSWPSNPVDSVRQFEPCVPIPNTVPNRRKSRVCVLCVLCVPFMYKYVLMI